MSDFYVYFNRKTLEIKSITTAKPGPDHSAVAVDEIFAMQCLNGQLNLAKYCIFDCGDDVFEIHPKSNIKYITPIKSSPLEMFGPAPDANIQITISEYKNQVSVLYNESDIKDTTRAILYFTKDDDPSFLKSTFILDINTLDKIQEENNLKHWPNPVVISVVDADDLSIFGPRSNLSISCVKENVKALNN